MPFFSSLEKDAGALEIFASDIRFAGVLKLIQDWMRGPSELTFAEREMIAAYVSALNVCPFCIATHKALAEAHGMDPSLLNVIVQADENGAPARFRPVLELARKVTTSPRAVSQDDIYAVTEAGFSEETAQVVIMVASLFSMINRVVEAHGIKSPPGEMDRIVDASR